MKVLVLGGSREGEHLFARLREHGVNALLLRRDAASGRRPSPGENALPHVIQQSIANQGELAQLCAVREVTHLIDATHPFTRRLSADAAAVANAMNLGRLRLRRAGWRAGTADSWIEVADEAAAAGALRPEWRRVMAPLGRDALTSFHGDTGRWYLLRVIGEPDAKLPMPDYHVLSEPGPYTVAGEAALMEAHRIDVLVARNTGGDGAWPKIAAARELGLPVVMISQPASPDGPTVETVEEVEAWLASFS